MNTSGAGNIDLSRGIPGQLQNLTIANLISLVLQILLAVAALVFFFWLILGGIKWIMSGGSAEKIEEARNQITAALVGLIIVFAAWAVAQLINHFFGVNLFDLDALISERPGTN